MDFKDSAKEAAFRSKAREWIEANAPIALAEALLAKTATELTTNEIDVVQEGKKWQQLKANSGWSCISWPKEFGGQAASIIEQVIWEQEEGIYADLNLPFAVGQGFCGPTIMNYGSDLQKERHVSQILRGEQIWCQLFSEPAAGSDLAGLRTKATPNGNGWLISGQKVWSSFAEIADFGLLLARTDPTVAKHRGLTMFLLDMKAQGLRLSPIRQMNGRSEFCEVFMDGVVISDEQRIGEVNEGWKVAMATLEIERVHSGGIGQTGLPELMHILKGVSSSSTGDPYKVSNKSKLADWHARAIGLENLTKRAMSSVSKGKELGAESSVNKLVIGQLLQEVSEHAIEIQVLNGTVFDRNLSVLSGRVQDFLLSAPGNRIAGGSDQILRNIIGEHVLGLPSEPRADKGIPFKDIPTG